jgi:hypothetical protein
MGFNSGLKGLSTIIEQNAGYCNDEVYSTYNNGCALCSLGLSPQEQMSY